MALQSFLETALKPLKFLKSFYQEIFYSNGGNGTVYIENGKALEEECVYVYIMSNAVIASLEDTNGVDQLTNLKLGGETVTAGSKIRLRGGKTIGTISLTSGTALGILK